MFSLNCWPLVQLEEHYPLTVSVPGSSPGGPAKIRGWNRYGYGVCLKNKRNTFDSYRPHQFIFSYNMDTEKLERLELAICELVKAYEAETNLKVVSINPNVDINSKDFLKTSDVSVTVGVFKVKSIDKNVTIEATLAEVFSDGSVAVVFKKGFKDEEEMQNYLKAPKDLKEHPLPVKLITWVKVLGK